MLYSDSLHEMEMVKSTGVTYTGNYYLHFDRTQGRSPIEFIMHREELEELSNKILNVLAESKQANIDNLKRVEDEKKKWQ